jgi:hypothetical protein
MNSSIQAQAPPVAEADVSLKAFFLAAVLWLPLAFFLWYMVRSLVVMLPIRLATAWLSLWLPEVVSGGSQETIDLVLMTQAHLDGVLGLPSTRLEVPVLINALTYCYGLPILIGLVMATPLTWSRTFLHLGIGYLVLLPCQTFGLVGDALKHLSFDYGSLVAAGIADAGYAPLAPSAGAVAATAMDATLKAHGMTEAAIGMWYQFGNLILPSIIPVIVWVLCNRRFIEDLTGRRTEPSAHHGGQTSS